MCSMRLGGTKHNVLLQNDVKDNRRFIMTSLRRHICPPKTPVLQLFRNGQLSYVVNKILYAEHNGIFCCDHTLNNFISQQ